MTDIRRSAPILTGRINTADGFSASGSYHLTSSLVSPSTDSYHSHLNFAASTSSFHVLSAVHLPTRLHRLASATPSSHPPSQFFTPLGRRSGLQRHHHSSGRIASQASAPGPASQSESAATWRAVEHRVMTTSYSLCRGLPQRVRRRRKEGSETQRISRECHLAVACRQVDPPPRTSGRPPLPRTDAPGLRQVC